MQAMVVAVESVLQHPIPEVHRSLVENIFVD